MKRCACRCIGIRARDGLDHQDRHDQQVVDLEREPGDRQNKPTASMRADHRLLQVGRVLAAEHGAARHLRARRAPRARTWPSSRPARPIARIGLMPVSTSANWAVCRRAWRRSSRSISRPRRTSPPNHSRRHQGDDQDDQQQLPRQQAAMSVTNSRTCEHRRRRAWRGSRSTRRRRRLGPDRVAPDGRPAGARNSSSGRRTGRGSAGSACRG